jgi:predicted MFS family arabinose efflux permease
LNNNRVKPLKGKPGFTYGSYIVAATWIMLFFPSSVAVGIFFKPILEEFNLDRAALSLVQTGAMLAFAVASPFLGRLIDRFGPKVILLACIATQTLTGVINGLATSIWQLYIARFLYEMKSTHAVQVLVNRWFVKKRGRAQGIVATGWPIGILVLSPFSQYLVQVWGWRMTMLFWAGVTFAILLPLTIFIRDNPEEKGYGPDGEPLNRPTPTDPSLKWPADAPALKPITGVGSRLSEAVKNGSFWLLATSQFICGIGCGFIMTHIVIFATDIGYSAMIGATFLSVQGGVNLIGVVFTGQLSDRISRSWVLAMTHTIRSISFLIVVISLLLCSGSLWLIYIAMGLFGFGFFTTAPLTAGLVADLFGYRQMGTLLGLMLTFHTVGMAIGAYSGGITFELTSSYFSFFAIQGVLEFLAAVSAFHIKRKAIY